ncbi:tRNA (adenosine(37)-N6)-threonylcarbamoyltransferase complex ATPase subunit type 1 TsaE [Sphingorhabdus sp.]|jgi:tRNA threonylcarbamoyladenosine biosynthesis protein TsaE|uniref:tRNA (adenosine(37)-N6)-threonylcarbamoyltransferase complex ATPase subunit type 1 TsaE n=1 Tax=Sphingorhabdus sp. TaxID=1902408 RepID=UPI003BAFB541|nr:tRNA (adenosine(37)-N6)-threonylcarbamoyltransferase complex ATPase subunit type 1 TsaE [Sphingomonadales bacterium]MBL0023044.1 tRNA (adenosine(37)-N6)-threonylcarbamoyltransferase complex ATPase subunit type 1 TsaE [Sphingomonadales bacterium]
MSDRHYVIASEAKMLEFGHAIVACLKPGMVVAIDGNLGAGKTVLSKGILRSLGFEGEVSSPTFTIVNQYDPPATRLTVLHADLYRIENVAELEELGLFDAEDAGAVSLIEWAGRFEAVLRIAAIKIRIETMAGNSRSVSITGDQHCLDGLDGFGIAHSA